MTHELQKLVVAPLLLLIQVERVRTIHLGQKRKKKKATRAILGLASPLQKRQVSSERGVRRKAAAAARGRVTGWEVGDRLYRSPVP